MYGKTALQRSLTRSVPPDDVVLIGCSKGAVDVLSLLLARLDLAPRVRCVVGWGGLFGGSYIADDIHASFVADDQVPMARQVGKRSRRLVPVVQVDRCGPPAGRGRHRGGLSPMRQLRSVNSSGPITAATLPRSGSRS